VRSILPREKNFGRVTSILPVESGLWLGTADHGVIEIDSSGNFINVLRNDDEPLPDRVNDLMKDNEGNIWIASTSSTFYSGNPIFSFFRTRKNDISKNIQSLVYSRDDKLWFSTDQGVFVVNTVGTRRQAEIRFPSTVSPQVISLFEDYMGKIWMGTFDHGVFIYNPGDKSMQQLTERDGLNNNNVLSIGGVGNQIWFATLGGISSCNIHQMPNGRMSFLFEDHKSGEDLGRNYVYKIHVDKKKRIWFATDGKGVFVFDHGKFRNHLIRSRSKSNIIYSLTEDASGGIWASTANAGLFRFNGREFEPFIPQNQIRDLAVTSIVGDKNGKVLLVSKQGIDVLDPRSKIIFYHGQESGIDNIDPNLNAFTYDGMGNIWLGTQNGIVKYNTNMSPVKKWPVTKINEVQVFLSKVDTTRRKFNHRENHISFDYVGLWYQDAADVSYKLKLQGYDREWISSRNHFITYPNLPPGRYIFMVRSSATNNFNGAPVQKYSFEIAPPFYSTPVFYLLCGLMLFGVMFWLVNAREKKLRETQKQEREKIQFQLETLKHQVNPHFLFNSFNTLIGVIEEDHETAVQYVEKLSDFYRDILINREKDVIPLAKEIDMIKNYYFLQVKRYKDNLRIHLEVAEEYYEHSIPPLTLQLLVENAIKHNIISSDKKLIIDIFVRGEDLIVRNNLQRKVTYEPSTGLGLQNIINRYKLLSDKEVSIEETASHFVVRVPLLNG
jgi:streptogramin lyase